MEQITTHIGWKSTQTAKYYMQTDKVLGVNKVADMLAQSTSAVDKNTAPKATIIAETFRFHDNLAGCRLISFSVTPCFLRVRVFPSFSEFREDLDTLKLNKVSANHSPSFGRVFSTPCLGQNFSPITYPSTGIGWLLCECKSLTIQWRIQTFRYGERGGGGRSGYPDPEIRRSPGLKKICGLNLGEWGGGDLPWIRHCYFTENIMGNPTFSQSSEIVSARTQYDDTLRDTTSK